ncbi:MAG: hypothetical protein COT00_00485, partial [Candidatus Omnitrophica bacterium CG07_land_8_20_14_0_80_50_8]
MKIHSSYLHKIFKVVFLVVLFTSHQDCDFLFALPQGQSVESGSATFENPDPNTLVVTTADKTVVNFSSFNIAANESVRFIQPSIDSFVLSRVTGNDPTHIYGNLYTNGNLMLVNPNGINIDATGVVQANSFIASTLNVSTNNFIAGNYILAHDGAGFNKVLNEGTITGKDVALVGSSAENRGVIVSEVGTVHLISGDKTTVSFDQRGLIQIEINEATSGKVFNPDGSTVKDAVANSGTIQAHEVIMSAKTASDIFENAVNQSGIVRATVVTNENGVIKFTAANETKATANDSKIKVGGTLDAGQGSTQITTDGSVEVATPLVATGDLTVKADYNIQVNADVTVNSG